MNIVIATATVKAKPGKESETEKELRALLQETHKESGCLRCALHRSADNPGSFLIVAKWSSMETINHHFQSAHLARFMKKSTEFLANPPDTKLYQSMPEGTSGKGEL